GVCFDTAHAFTAGYDIRDEDGLSATFDALERNVGTANIRAVHFNDSKADYNSRVDRHWHIGLGHIGGAALARVAQHPELSHAAFILETPLGLTAWLASEPPMFCVPPWPGSSTTVAVIAITYSFQTGGIAFTPLYVVVGGFVSGRRGRNLRRAACLRGMPTLGAEG
ncbi:MAG TPA: TIM barrel protein, partial [Pyrinomonadaceae bacterium]|nr:TIM barrel protein [Pyrinomonadaceae bacterium]